MDQAAMRDDAPRRPRSSAPGCRASAPATTSRPSAPGPATPSSRPATPSAGRGTCSATRASARTPTCTRSATRSGPGTARSPSPTATPSCSTSRTRPPSRASTATFASTTGSTAADWSTAESRWHVTAERTDTGRRVHLTAGFLFSCTGYYRYDHGYLPDFAGMERLRRAPIVHPQDWPEDLDYAGKRVVVIGSGATAVTLVPALAALGRPRDHAPTLAELHRLAARARARSPRRCSAACCRPSTAGHGRPAGSTPS